MTNQDLTDKIFDFFVRFSKLIIGLLLLTVIVVVAGVAYFFYGVKSSTASLAVNEKIDNTPICVERLRQIGEWEFLCVSNEEIVDTTRKRLFKDDELTRIYTGNLRIGVDMREMKDDAIQLQGDTIVVNLPEVKLLDEKFIDEAATKSFYESGRWTGADYELLYKKAQRQMKEHCLTKENLHTARENGKSQMRKMLEAVGVEKFIVN